MLDRPTIEFDEARHAYTVGGEKLPSVTRVLEQINELDGIPKAVLAAAADFGRNAHLACHLYDLKRLDEPNLDTNLAPYLAAWKAFLKESGAVVLESEVRVAHTRFKYAGTLDKIVLLRERRTQIDIKSGEVPRTVGPQCAAYECAYNWHAERGEVLRARYSCQLRGDGTYRLAPLRDTTDFSIFISALNLYNWRNRGETK